MGARAALIPLGETVSAKVGASALGQAIKAGWNTALPYTAGTLTTGNAVGLGFGMHGATTMKPNLDKFIAICEKIYFVRTTVFKHKRI